MAENMSIAEKLELINENMEKVYQAGVDYGISQSGGAAVIEELNITQNGTYTASDGVDGYSPISVNIPSVNEADILKYITSSGSVQNLFAQANFGGKDEIRIEMPNPPAGLASMFGRTLGVKKIILIVPTTKQYNATTFIYGHSNMTSDLEELVIPDGIEFTNVNGFARYDGNLKKISFLTEDGAEGQNGINLSAVTDTTNCFINCNSLEEIRFVPNTITKTISFAQSANLTEDSIKSIIQGLSPDVSGQILTLHSSIASMEWVQEEFTNRGLAGWTLPY